MFVFFSVSLSEPPKKLIRVLLPEAIETLHVIIVSRGGTPWLTWNVPHFGGPGDGEVKNMEENLTF